VSDATQGSASAVRGFAEEIRRLHTLAGEPAEFWPAFLDALRGFGEADICLAAVKQARQQDEQEPGWRVLALAPASVRGGPHAQAVLAQLDALWDACAGRGTVVRGLDEGGTVAAAALAAGEQGMTCLAVLFFRPGNDARADSAVGWLPLVADTPAVYQLGRIAREAQVQVEHFAGTLDLLVLLNAEDRFLAAAMVLCNELASRHRCERVSVGWLTGGYIRLQAMSHVEHFDRKMEAVQKLESAMEEALDQDEEIVYPAEPGTDTVLRDHERFAQEFDVPHLCSVVLRVEGEPVAVCTFERSAPPFATNELRLFRLYCDQAARRLADLKRSDRWFGARLAQRLREWMAPLLWVQHTWAKALAILGSVLLGFLCFGRLPYRVEATCILRTDDLAYLTAPFAGHIERVAVRVGDEMPAAATLLWLDRADLLLEEAAAIAERNRYARESEKARAANALADMRIADALREQAAVRLALVRHRLAQAEIRAPFDGVVVEGDLIERVGAPVEQGDVLFKFARIERLYVELEVDERDIHNLAGRIDGEVAFSSRPQDTFRIRVARFEPVAVAREEGNVFTVHCDLLGTAQDWWRPGMTGVAKLNVGRRSPLWIVTHRTIDFLRLKLWW